MCISAHAPLAVDELGGAETIQYVTGRKRQRACKDSTAYEMNKAASVRRCTPHETRKDSYNVPTRSESVGTMVTYDARRVTPGS